MLRGLRGSDGRLARDVVGSGGWDGVDAALDAYRGSSLGFEGLVALLAHVLHTRIADVYQQVGEALRPKRMWPRPPSLLACAQGPVHM